ncbi:MAG: zinc-ribbon domain-containing protein [Asgard group archaeon]|nr:zinc-ribbon domain-containing protein [Asgard group archaeon]
MDTTNFCPHCGVALSENVDLCPDCGTNLRSTTQEQPHTTQPDKPLTSAASKKSKRFFSHDLCLRFAFFGLFIGMLTTSVFSWLTYRDGVFLPAIFLTISVCGVVLSALGIKGNVILGILSLLLCLFGVFTQVIALMWLIGSF